ncbi:MAG TPA: FixH family protein [Cyclobacteriaceae bacterium]|nr:FixH family protein [Cyclobacteriaceae bacterium]HNU42240.1 FixH family protein [Cyclobacteriaceae bacterium]
MKWIWGSFVLFALFIGTLIFIAMKQEVSLVSKNYYEDELKHSEKMQRQSNVNALASKPELSFEGNKVKITFSQFNQIENGKLTVQRPSKEALDYQFEVPAISDSNQYFELKNWEAGLYRIGFSWKAGGKEYYFEKLLVL